jgi:Fur family ferric uptake transcriptional regulator
LSCKTFFLKKLQENGFRLTPQREMILTTLHELKDFATAEEIYSRVQPLSASVTRSTVYRTLELLQGFRLVARVDSKDGQHLYTLMDIEAPHLHLRCRRCGQITGVELKQFEPFMRHLSEQYGFEIDVENLYLTGLCRVCRTAPDEATN